jgi:hypothetical protein
MLEDGDPGARASFSNVVVRPAEVRFDFSQAPPPPEREPPGVVRSWEISAPFTPPAGTIRALPATASAGDWQNVRAEPSGLVVAERFVKRPEGVERPAVLARVVLDSESDAVRELRFGYSDEVTVFLNGKPLFSGDAHYSHDNPRQEGLIGLWQGSRVPPAEEGPQRARPRRRGRVRRLGMDGAGGGCGGSQGLAVASLLSSAVPVIPSSGATRDPFDATVAIDRLDDERGPSLRSG